MAKICTLKKQKDFKLVYQKGKVFGNRNLVMHYLKNGKDTNRLGIIVSKKFPTARWCAIVSGDSSRKPTGLMKISLHWDMI